MLHRFKRLTPSRAASTWIMVVLLAAIPATTASVLQPSPVERPVLVIYGPSTHDLGSGKPGEVLAGQLVLSNRGTSLLEYNLRTSCSCAKLNPAHGQIAPQDSVEINLGLRLRTEGRDELLTVFVSSNDPAQPEVQHVFRARCAAALTASPEFVDFGRLALGESPRRAILLFDATGKGLPPDTPIIISNTLPFIHVIKEAAADARCSLLVKVHDNAPAGSFSDLLSVVVHDRTIVIPISGTITTTYSVVPPVLYLPKTNPAHKGAEHTIIVHRNDGRPIEYPDKLVCPTGVVAERIGSTHANSTSFCYRVQVSPSFRWEGQAQISFSFAGCSDQVHCRLQAIE